MKIVLDAMGGDRSVKTIVEGAVDSVNEYNIDLILTGDKEKIQVALDKFEYNKNKIEIIHCSQEITMNDKPLSALRKKKDSSIGVGIKLVESGKADAFVSAGNTGAVMAAATVKLKLLEGVERPGIATTMPNRKSSATILIDAGANIECKPEHIVKYAIMGNEYAKILLNIESPKVGLLNIGEEIVKGNELTKKSYELLEKSDLNFIGNVEGRDIFLGEVNVVVCDGFTGNVILKVSEGLAETLFNLIKEGINSKFLYKIGGLLLKPFFKKFAKLIDSDEYGGAPLLGVNGYCIICHGNSKSKAIKNAIGVSKKFIEKDINSIISNSIKNF